jgi:hypothetical protein
MSKISDIRFDEPCLAPPADDHLMSDLADSSRLDELELVLGMIQCREKRRATA